MTRRPLRTMRPTVVLAVARAETRTTLRLIHYWLFALLSVGLGCMVYLQLAVTHGDYSGTASGLGTFSPPTWASYWSVRVASRPAKPLI